MGAGAGGEGWEGRAGRALAFLLPCPGGGSRGQLCCRTVPGGHGQRDGDSAGERCGGPPGRASSRREGPWGAAPPPSASEINCAACGVAQSCPTLCDPVDLQPARLHCPWGFSRQEHWSGLLSPPPGDLPSRDRTQVSRIAGGSTREALRLIRGEFCRHREPSLGAGFPAGEPGT